MKAAMILFVTLAVFGYHAEASFVSRLSHMFSGPVVSHGPAVIGHGPRVVLAAHQTDADVNARDRSQAYADSVNQAQELTARAALSASHNAINSAAHNHAITAQNQLAYAQSVAANVQAQAQAGAVSRLAHAVPSSVVVSHGPAIVGRAPVVVSHGPAVVSHGPAVVSHGPALVARVPSVVAPVIGHAPRVLLAGQTDADTYVRDRSQAIAESVNQAKELTAHAALTATRNAIDNAAQINTIAAQSHVANAQSVVGYVQGIAANVQAQAQAGIAHGPAVIARPSIAYGYGPAVVARAPVVTVSHGPAYGVRAPAYIARPSVAIAHGPSVVAPVIGHASRVLLAGQSDADVYVRDRSQAVVESVSQAKELSSHAALTAARNAVDNAAQINSIAAQNHVANAQSAVGYVQGVAANVQAQAQAGADAVQRGYVTGYGQKLVYGRGYGHY